MSGANACLVPMNRKANNAAPIGQQCRCLPIFSLCCAEAVWRATLAPCRGHAIPVPALLNHLLCPCASHHLSHKFLLRKVRCQRWQKKAALLPFCQRYLDRGRMQVTTLDDRVVLAQAF